MKILVAILASFVAFGSSSYAQNTLTTTMPSNESDFVRGFRVGIFKSALNVHAKVSAESSLSEGAGKVDQAYGVSLGYVSLPIKSLGWTASGSMAQMKNNGGEPFEMLKLDGNLAFAFNKSIYAKAGINTNKFVSGFITPELSPGIGGQVGLGFQITSNFGIDVSYTESRQKGNVNIFGSDLSVEYKISGFEFGVNGTF